MQALRISGKKPKTKNKSQCTRRKPKMQAENRSQNTGRGVVEKHRRQQMKNLYLGLASLLPPLTSKEKLPLPALLERSFDYVKRLKERIDLLEARKEALKEDLVMAAVEVNEKGSMLEVNLVTGLNKGPLLHEVIRILEEAGAQVLSANYSIMSDRIVYSITSQAFSSRIGIDTSRVHEKLKILSGSGFVSPAI